MSAFTGHPGYLLLGLHLDPAKISGPVTVPSQCNRDSADGTAPTPSPAQAFLVCPACKLALVPFPMLATLTASQHMPFHLPDFLAFVKRIDVSI